MKLVPAVITAKLGRNALLLQKHSPTILFGVGVAGVLGGTILASRATLKMTEVLDESGKKLDAVKAFAGTAHIAYTENDRAHDITLIKVQTGIKIVKLYAPAVIVSGIGIAALTSSHKILTNRNASLMAAYATLDEAFKRYRGRVVDKYGEQADREFRYDTETVEIGEGKKKQEVVRVAPGEPSGYARFFDQFCSDWGRDPEVNLFFLKCQQNYCNDLLKARGHVFLNEVYDRLGMDRTGAGAVVGWILSDDGSTDNYISFGVFEGQSENSRDFVNGREGAVLCDFNVDGVIWDKIDKTKEDLSWQRKQ
jgi:hypothetical protein